MCQPAAQFHVLRPHFVGILITQAGRASKREGGGSREGRHIAHSKIRILKKPLDRNQNAKTWMTNNVILTNTKKKTKLYIIIIYICKNLTKYDITATFGKETKQIKIRPSNKKQL